MSIDDITELPPDRIPLNVALRMIDYGEMAIVTISEVKELTVVEYANALYILKRDAGYYRRMLRLEESEERKE